VSLDDWNVILHGENQKHLDECRSAIITMITDKMNMPRFDPSKDKLPGLEHTAAGRCMCGGEYDQTLLQETGNKLCTSCGGYTEILGRGNPSLNDQAEQMLRTFELFDYSRRFRRNYILFTIITNAFAAFVGIYAIYILDVNMWLVWAVMLLFFFAVRPPKRRFVQWFSRPKQIVAK
jgi:hypothetical protein